MSHPEHLLLDSAIRDWVVFPMLLMLLLVGMGRHYVQTAIKSVPTFTEKDIAEQQYKNVCMQSSCLRMNGNFLSEAAFNTRKANMIRRKTGKIYQANKAISQCE
jgi:ER membrane protein complex subunit 3